MYIDLHVHTTESDGSHTVGEVIDVAAKNNIKYLAITDHETMKGVDEAIHLGNKHGIYVIPGVELVTAFRDKEVHLLGYFSVETMKNVALQSRLKELRLKRTALAYEMVKRLQNEGFTLKWPEVEEIASPEGAVSKGHIMRALYDHERGKMHWPTIAKIFHPQGKVYLPFLEHDFEEAVDMIIQCGGVPVLAHPGLIFNDKIVGELLEVRSLGLEVYYGYWENREELISEYRKLANEKALFATGGSDFHSTYGPVNIGEIDVPDSCIENLFEHLSLYRMPLKAKENF